MHNDILLLYRFIRICDIIVRAQIYQILFEKQILPRIDRQEGQNLPQSVNDKRKRKMSRQF